MLSFVSCIKYWRLYELFSKSSSQQRMHVVMQMMEIKPTMIRKNTMNKIINLKSSSSSLWKKRLKISSNLSKILSYKRFTVAAYPKYFKFWNLWNYSWKNQLQNFHLVSVWEGGSSIQSCCGSVLICCCHEVILTNTSQVYSLASRPPNFNSVTLICSSPPLLCYQWCRCCVSTTKCYQP